MDRYGRKISETTGIIYLSPATKDESQINNSNNLVSTINRNVLLDPSLDGFFYRTDAIIIEKWQLWDDDDLTGSRPRPPASPFGLHQGLYHDDLTNEIHKYLRHMDDEERSSSCSSSSSSTDHNRHHHEKSKTFSHLHTGSFDPSSIPNNMGTKKLPIIIEKVVPNPMITRPPQYLLEQSDQSFNPFIPIQQSDNNCIPFSETYQINEHGEKITQDGNRILFMDVIQPNMIDNKLETKSYITPKSRRKRSKHIPIIDLRSVENLLQEKKFKQREKSIDKHEKNFEDNHLSTSDMLEVVESYFEDYQGRKSKLNNDDAQTMLEHFQGSHKKEHRRTKSPDNITHHRRRRKRSTLTAGPSVNYVERPAIRAPSQPKSIEPEQQSISTVLNNEQVDEYVSNVYGTPEKTSRPSSPINHQESQQSSTNTNKNIAIQQDYLSPFRYMQSSVNPLLFREYRNAFYGI